MRTRWRGAVNGVMISAAVAIVSIGAYVGLLQYSGNIHVVENGLLYRSAQLDKADFEHVIKQYGIKSIVNLRGAAPQATWYDDEVDVSHTFGVTHYDYRLSARRFVSRRQIAELLALLRSAPKPLLIHCQAGADRTGLAAALYEAEIANKSIAEADEQLSLRYGHFPYLTSETKAMDESFWAYVKGPEPAQ